MLFAQLYAYAFGNRIFVAKVVGQITCGRHLNPIVRSEPRTDVYDCGSVGKLHFGESDYSGVAIQCLWRFPDTVLLAP